MRQESCPPNQTSSCCSTERGAILNLYTVADAQIEQDQLIGAWDPVEQNHLNGARDHLEQNQLNGAEDHVEQNQLNRAEDHVEQNQLNRAGDHVEQNQLNRAGDHVEHNQLNGVGDQVELTLEEELQLSGHFQSKSGRRDSTASRETLDKETGRP